MTRTSSWDAPPSVYDLIQWHVRDDPWKVLVVCVFCNQTRRLSAEPLIWKFFELWPTATEAAKADRQLLASLLKPLGLQNRRAGTLIKLSQAYMRDDWSDPRELPGVGDYAGAAWDIFVEGRWQEIDEPKDHALKNYWLYLWDWQDAAFLKSCEDVQNRQDKLIDEDFRQFSEFCENYEI